MCIDPVTNTIYLFGGWDGENDLSDMWSYNISEDKWSIIFKCVFVIYIYIYFLDLFNYCKRIVEIAKNAEVLLLDPVTRWF